jgi:rod shape-determining protein MreD
MPGRRAVFYAVLVITAALLQVTALNRLPLPLARPDLLVVVVVAAGLASGRSLGTVVGFAAGLLADTMPPAYHDVGRLALVYAVIGYLAGRLEDLDEVSALGTILAVAVASVAAELGAGGLGMLTGDPRVDWPAALPRAGLLALYDVVLAPFVVPPVLALARRVTPELDRT